MNYVGDWPLFETHPSDKFQIMPESLNLLKHFGLTGESKQELPSVYIAARYARREEMEVVADKLTETGFKITSHWVYGGEVGKTYEDIALMDLEDVEIADIVLSYTEPYGTLHKGGGRHVEFGYGLALGKEMAIVGYTENVFHYYPNVRRYDNLDDFIRFYVR